jgi:hypothetical protein
MLEQDMDGGADGGNLIYLDRLYSDCGLNYRQTQTRDFIMTMDLVTNNGFTKFGVKIIISQC